MPPMREGDWICPTCENHNFASRQSCNKCQGPKAPESGGSYGAQRIPAAQPRSSPYGGGVASSGPPGSERQQQTGELKEGDWICPGCGNHNYASRIACNKCQELKEGMKEGDWICRSCKNHNFAKKMQCNKCHIPRQQGDQNFLAGKGRSHSAPPAGGGFGGGCSPYGGCGAYGGGGYGGKGGGMVPYGYGAPGGNFGPYGGGGYGGKGQVFHGKGMMQPMYMQPMMQQPQYGMAAPMQSNTAMKEGDWMCPSCGNHNFASRINCNKCKSLRAGFKDGDWVCKGCKNHNFKSRQECNKCKQPKE